MNFAGLPFAQLAGIFAAAAVVATALYILKLRRRAVAVPFSPLWQRILQDKEATSLFSRLKRLLSLLLQLLLVALLVLALGDPRAAVGLVKGRTLVVLVDTSASMQATDAPPFVTRLDKAKAEIKGLVTGLGGADRMLIAEMSATTTPLGPFSGDTGELERSLDGLAPTEARADFPRALRFALDAVRGAENPEVVIVSDGALGEAKDAFGDVRLGETKLSFVKVGTEARNVGVTEFSVRRYPLDKNRYEVMLELENTGPETEDVELSLFGDDTLVDVTKLRLKAGEKLPRFYPNLSGASRTLEAKLRPLGTSKDFLPADDHAYALLPERRRAKVLVVTSGNTYLEAALLLDEYLDVEQIAPAAYATSKATQTAKYDVVIFDGVTPLVPVETNALYLDPSGDGSPVKVGEEIKFPGFDKIDRKHPTVRFLALDDVNIASGHALTPQKDDKVVGASDQGAILVAGQRSGKKFVALGFDVRGSDLPLRMAWPLFLLDSINWFTDEDAQYLSSFRTGEVWRIPLAEPVPTVTLHAPGGAAVVLPAKDGRASYLGERAGFYDMTAGASSTRFAANLLDREESALSSRDTLTVDGKEAGRVAAFSISPRRDFWVYLLLAAVVLTAVEWATYHRRVTV